MCGGNLTVVCVFMYLDSSELSEKKYKTKVTTCDNWKVNLQEN